nr:lymphoid-restricted membrane protein [Odocoileus virginianus texanus]
MEEEAKKQRGTAKFSPSRLAVSGGSKGGVVRGGVNSLLMKEATLQKEVEDGDGAAHSAGEEAKPSLHKLEEAISDQRNLQTINTELVNTCQTLGQKTRKPKNALHLDSLTAIPRLELTPFSCVANLIHASRERPRYEEIEDGALAVTERHKEYSTLPSPGHTSSTESTVTSSDSGSEILHMASGELDCKPLCEKEEDKRSASAVTKIQGRSPAPEKIELQGSVSEEKSIMNLEAKREPETIDEHRKECAAGGAALSSLPVKSVNFRQSDNTSANEKEVEAEFLRLSLGFKCDWFTLEKRVKLEERSRDLAEENLKKEITNCLKLLESLASLCEDDSQAQEIVKKLEKSVTFLSQCATRVASRAEMLGAINQESRVSKAVEVMIQHVENLKRMYAKEHAELEELKQVLLQNERSFNPLEDEDDCQTKKRSSSVNSKPSSLRRVTIASLPRNIGNAGMLAGMENNDRFSRRSSSWLDTILIYRTKDDLEPPEEETVEKTRKSSLSEKKTNPSKWNVSSIYDTLASWATNLKTSIREANKALWLSVAFIVLFAALMSFFTGRFFQKPVDAAPTQDGDPWMSLEHILWPFTRLRHNGPPPV